MKWVLTNFSELRFDGFADEIGSDSYKLFIVRAKGGKCCGVSAQSWFKRTFGIQAHGRIKLSPEEVKEEIEYHRWPEGGIDWIQVNRREGVSKYIIRGRKYKKVNDI